MDIKDFELDENLDLVIRGGKFAVDEDGITLIKTALFTNSRVGNAGGYWLPIASSPMWQLKQSRNNDAVEGSKAMKQAVKYLEANKDFVLDSSGVTISDEQVKFTMKYRINNRNKAVTF